MIDLAKPCLSCYFSYPFFELRAGNIYGFAAVSAHDVMMMTFSIANAVKSFALVILHNVYLASFSKSLQVAIDGSESHIRARKR
ncbi:hypothetical protein HMPREF3163_05525 [Actinomyces sp. HMSC08A01]|nr:hypothetical protein HMPREF3163_05525 [Actinomyces sp. HMSC08A01]